ncbi:MAG: hypothetical protein PHC53_00890 [Patescibacteria group bacterium]|nr:hypothetical protein [Patescibacteria group bacterium]
MRNFVASFVLVFVSLIAASCVDRQRTPGVETTLAGSSQAAPSLPAACQGQQPARENLMNGGSQLLAVKCSCTQNNRQYIWYNAVLVGSDPGSYCPPNFPVFEEPVGQESSNVALPPPVVTNALAPVASLPPLPLPSASAVPPVPPTAKSAPVPVQQAIFAKDVHYECRNGVAQRDYFMVIEHQGHRTEQAIQQQCVGAGIECLTEEADQKNPEKPPCVCPEGQHTKKINAKWNTWACEADKASKSPSK